jgi:hypothetical protein
MRMVGAPYSTDCSGASTGLVFVLLTFGFVLDNLAVWQSMPLEDFSSVG